MNTWNGISPDELPDSNRDVLVSVKWMDVPCVAWYSVYGWIPNEEYVDAVGHSLSRSDVEGWMELPKPKWMVERDAEDKA